MGKIVDLSLASGRHLGDRRLCAVLLAGVVLALSLVSGAAGAAASEPSAGIAWSPCPKVSGYLCGTLRVPLDYQHPSRGSISLAVMEHPVPQSKGDIVFNPGGPGESGDLILPILASLMPQAVKDQFTFVSFDERGTGSSEPLALRTLCCRGGQRHRRDGGRRPRPSPVWSSRAGPATPLCSRR